MHPAVRHAMNVHRYVKNNRPEKKEPTRREKLIATSLNYISKHELETRRALENLDKWAEAVQRWRKRGVKFKPPQQQYPAVLDIFDTVRAHFGVSQNEFESKRKTADLVHCRFVAYYLAKKHTKRSFPEIGRFVGARDHSTIIHGAQRIGVLMDMHPEVREEVEELERRILADFEKQKQASQTDSQAEGAANEMVQA